MAEGFTIQSSSQLWKRFLTVEDRLVRYPDGRENAFDILGSPKIDYKVRRAQILRSHHVSNFA